MKIKLTKLLVLCAAVIVAIKSDACTRVVHKVADGYVMTARSMDWKEPMHSDLWIFPRGMERDGAVGEKPYKWTSKYGSVVTSSYGIATSDGINEKGLVSNLLWLAESAYPEWNGKSKSICISVWVQFMLDNFATVDEAVKFFDKNSVNVVSGMMPDGSRMATLHLAISDSTGDSAIFEYINGELVVHHSPNYKVMTNSPIYSEQLALNEYWKGIGGTTFLPGTNRAADRFVRASFYVDAIPKVADQRVALAGIFSVIRNVSVPYGITTPGQPHISSTLWRTVSDQKNMMYFFESALSPNIFWVDLKKVNFDASSPVKRLAQVETSSYRGDVTDEFVASAPFTFFQLK